MAAVEETDTEEFINQEIAPLRQLHQLGAAMTTVPTELEALKRVKDAIDHERSRTRSSDSSMALAWASIQISTEIDAIHDLAVAEQARLEAAEKALAEERLHHIHDLAVAEQARLDAAEKAIDDLIERGYTAGLSSAFAYRKRHLMPQPDAGEARCRHWYGPNNDDYCGAKKAAHDDTIGHPFNAGYGLTTRCAMGWCGKPATDGLYCPAHAGPHRKFVLPSERCEHDMPKKICIACGTPTASPDVLWERAIDVAEMDTAFTWVIEMQGAAYLGVRKLGCYEFFWTTDHMKALRFKDAEQADLTKEAVRELRPDLFPTVLTDPIRPVMHGWLTRKKP